MAVSPDLYGAYHCLLVLCYYERNHDYIGKEADERIMKLIFKIQLDVFRTRENKLCPNE